MAVFENLPIARCLGVTLTLIFALIIPLFGFLVSSALAIMTSLVALSLAVVRILIRFFQK